MTNDEIIKILKEFIRQRYELHVHSFTMDEVFTNVISSLEENTKLKSDIEQLRWISYENIKTENDTHNRTIKEKESEIEQLKVENEKFRKMAKPNFLANKIFTDMYSKLQEENEQLKADLEKSVKLPCKVGDKIYSFWYYDEKPYKIQERVVKTISNIVNLLEDGSFGKTVFLTIEEAEQALKGQVECEV